jgi:translation initiation factor eIF-2B subunit gamma
MGTCALLRQFSSRISEDFVIVPCDFIPPQSLPLTLLLNKFRVDTLSEGSIATTCWYASHEPAKGAFLEEWGPIPSSTPIIWDPSTGTLLHIDTTDNLDRNVQGIELKMSLLRQYVTLDLHMTPSNASVFIFTRYSRAKLSSVFQDSHVYVCRRYVLDLLHEKQQFTSLREEFFPWLCTIQYQRGKRARYGQSLFFINQFDLRLIYEAELSSSNGLTSQRLSLQHSTLLPLTSTVEENDGLNPSVPASPTPSEHNDCVSLKIGVVIHHHEVESATRVNTLHNFYEINKRV